MVLSPDTVTLHLICAFEVVAIGLFFKPSQLADVLTRPLTFRIGTKALPFASSRIREIQLTTVQAFTTSSFFHNPQNLRKGKTRSKENTPSKHKGIKEDEEKILKEGFKEDPANASPVI
jgi:hypothetical protein